MKRMTVNGQAIGGQVRHKNAFEIDSPYVLVGRLRSYRHPLGLM